MTLAATEIDRQKIQATLDQQRTLKERNALGQFATPLPLAREIARVALDYLGRGPIHFLEPSLGSGAFFSALLSEREVASAKGVEFDPRFAAAARSLWGSSLKVIRGDFCTLRPPVNEQLRANLVLANPPYVRHHHLGAERKSELQARAELILGGRISGLTGLYVYFMILAHEWMETGGIAAWLVPSEWMDVNYGSSLKQYLCNKVELLRVHRFEAADVQFDDAFVSSSVVFFRKVKPPTAGTCEFTSGPSLTRPERSVIVSTVGLRDELKWTQRFRDKRTVSVPTGPSTVLGDLVDVRRGVATGNNGFFVRPRDEFLELGVPNEFLVPILPSSRHLDGDTIERGPDGYPIICPPLALLACDLPENDVRRSWPKLWKYLESPIGKETRGRYLSQHRSPWYAQEKRPYAPVIATYMGRGRKGAKPFRFFWNKSDATTTNVFLLLLPKGNLAALLRRSPEHAKTIVDFLTGTDVAELIGHGRVYGGGLHKLEPKELGRLDATALMERLGLRPQPMNSQQSLFGNSLWVREPVASLGIRQRTISGRVGSAARRTKSMVTARAPR